MPPSHREQQSLFKEIKSNVVAIRDEASLVDVVGIFLIIPAVIVGVELVIQMNSGSLSQLSRVYFEFPLSAENFWSPSTLLKALISSYAHRNLHPHLSGNLIMYFMTMTGLYSLALISDRKKEFRYMFILTVGVLPFLIAYQNLQVGIKGTTMGFSGLVGALLGILPVAVVAAAKERTGVGLVPVWTAAPVVLLLGFFSFVHTSSVQILIACTVCSLLIGGLMLLSLGITDFQKGLEEILWPGNIFSFWAVTIAILGPYALFFAFSPETNLVAHLGGYLDGYFMALIFFWDTPNPSFTLPGISKN